MADASTHLFRASLRGRLYRDVELPSSRSLEDLAAAIVCAFGFDFDHAFGFCSNLTGRYHEAEERRVEEKQHLFAHLGKGDAELGPPNTVGEQLIATNGGSRSS